MGENRATEVESEHFRRMEEKASSDAHCKAESECESEVYGLRKSLQEELDLYAFQFGNRFFRDKKDYTSKIEALREILKNRDDQVSRLKDQIVELNATYGVKAEVAQSEICILRSTLEETKRRKEQAVAENARLKRRLEETDGTRVENEAVRLREENLALLLRNKEYKRIVENAQRRSYRCTEEGINL